MSQPSDTRPPDSGLTDEKQYDYGDYYHSANKRPRPDDDAEGSRGHPSHVSHQHPGHSIHPPAQQSPSTPISGPKRASQACLRCRKQKLRCLGGYPCSRCVKAKHQCDFGGPAGAPGPRVVDSAQRIETLEANVAALLAGMSANSGQAQAAQQQQQQQQQRQKKPKQAASEDADVYPQAEMLRPLQPEARIPLNFDGRVLESSSNGASAGNWNDIPPPTHVRPFDPPRFPRSPEAHVHFPGSPLHTSPSYTSTASVFGPSPASGTGGSRGGGAGGSGGIPQRRRSRGQKAEERLAAATDDDAPFKPLLYQPTVWDNREESRRASPQLSSGASRTSEDMMLELPMMHRGRDDPVSTELVDEGMARILFGFFVQNLHPFCPVVDVSDEDAFLRVRQQSATLLSATLAIAARFYPRYIERQPSASLPPIAPDLPARLAQLAEHHLAQTMLRKQHHLTDVQAVLLLAAWGLQSGGKGPDAWIVTGHAARIARRLGIPRDLAAAAAAARVAVPNSPEWTELEGHGSKWRTWLCWFTFDGFLSLGFGRPQSTQFETVDEAGFLQMRLSSPLPVPGTLAATQAYGDAYIAGQVQLTQIGRDLINWGDALSDPRATEVEELQGRDISVRAMFSELNARLDEWSKRWIWSNSPYLAYLGPSARIGRLQAEHMRLCLNSFALKAPPDELKLIGDALARGLQAAMSTIQTYHESSQTDLALSFATDYLTITLGQAAVFLIRIAKASPAIQAAAKVDPPVVTHYLKMSIEVLAVSDLSETRLSSYLARTLRDISRAAGIPVGDDDGLDGTNGIVTAEGSRPTSADKLQESGEGGNGVNNAEVAPDLERRGGGTGTGTVTPAWDLDNLFNLEEHVDLGYLLGLPGDSSAIGSGMSFEYEGFGMGMMQ